MKNQIIIAVLLLSVIGCAKAPAPAVPSPAFASPNTNESLLMGTTWYLTQQVITTSQSVISYTGYSNNYYINFMYGAGSDANTAKYFTSNWMPNIPAPPNVTTPSPDYGLHGYWDYTYSGNVKVDSSWVILGYGSSFWYCNSPLLSIGATQSFVVNSAGVLTVTWTDGNSSIVSTLN